MSLNPTESVALIYSERGALVAQVPSHKANENYRKTYKGMERPAKGTLVNMGNIVLNNKLVDCQFSVLNPNYLYFLLSDSTFLIVNMLVDLNLMRPEYQIRLSDTLTQKSSPLSQ